MTVGDDTVPDGYKTPDHCFGQRPERYEEQMRDEVGMNQKGTDPAVGMRVGGSRGGDRGQRVHDNRVEEN